MIPRAVDMAARPLADLPLVLIVEDEEPLAEMVAVIVREAGYRSVVARHGREALKLARAERPALLLTDLMLPHLDGTEIIAALRADAATSGVPAPPMVLMTAANLGQARAAGAEVVLRKPFRLEDLEALLRRFLGPPAPDSAAPASDE
ncbi:MAG TPA: response regulator [Chloroflexota bacterium]|nr:response regulator [Chloroflexota bacterium]